MRTTVRLAVQAAGDDTEAAQDGDQRRNACPSASAAVAGKTRQPVDQTCRVDATVVIDRAPIAAASCV
jgi:hypothetical protein